MKLKNLVNLLLEFKWTLIGVGLELAAWLAIKNTPFYNALLDLKYFDVKLILVLIPIFLTILNYALDKQNIDEILDED